MLRNEIYDQAVARLAALGGTAEEVAASLIREDCKGWLADTQRCPVAFYLAKKGFDQPSVTRRRITLDPGEFWGLIRIKTPDPVRDFLAQFDGGEFPGLEISTDE